MLRCKDTLNYGEQMPGLNITTRRDFRRKLKSKAELSKWTFYQLELLWKDCIRAFIIEAIKYIHVDTGMSEASVYDLATNVRVANQVIADIMGKGPNPPRLQYDHEPGKKKSIPYGKELGRSRGKAYDYSFGAPSNPHLEFKFKIMVYQYKLYEFGFTDDHGNSFAPWNSLEYGKIAFINAWESNILKRLGSKRVMEFLLPKGTVKHG